MSHILRNTDKEQYNILILGETGSGKSTFINYLTNYFNNGTLGNLKVAIPTKHHKATENLNHSELNLDDSSMSKTSKCASYSFEKDSFNFTFIDTPGLSATEGSAKDDEHIQNIMKAAAEKEFLVAILIVINGAQARATVNVRNTLYQLKNSVPDIFLDNLFVALTNCLDNSVNFDLKQLKPWTIPPENVFHMNNSALCKPSLSSAVRQQKLVELQWEISMDEINKMVERLKQQCKKATDVFEQMRIRRAEITQKLMQICVEIERYQDLRNTLQQNQPTFSRHIVKYSNYKNANEVPYVKLSSSQPVWKSFFKKLSAAAAIVTAVTVATYAVVGVALGAAATVTATTAATTAEIAIVGLPATLINYANLYMVSKKKVMEIIQEASRLCGRKFNSSSDLETDVKLLEDAINVKLVEFQECCKGLKKICSLFNLMDVLQCTIETKEKDACTHTTMKDRAGAKKTIDIIKEFMVKLEELNNNTAAMK